MWEIAILGTFSCVANMTVIPSDGRNESEQRILWTSSNFRIWLQMSLGRRRVAAGPAERGTHIQKNTRNWSPLNLWQCEVPGLWGTYFDDGEWLYLIPCPGCVDN